MRDEFHGANQPLFTSANTSMKSNQASQASLQSSPSTPNSPVSSLSVSPLHLSTSRPLTSHLFPPARTRIWGFNLPRSHVIVHCVSLTLPDLPRRRFESMKFKGRTRSQTDERKDEPEKEKKTNGLRHSLV